MLTFKFSPLLLILNDLFSSLEISGVNSSSTIGSVILFCSSESIVLARDESELKTLLDLVVVLDSKLEEMLLVEDVFN